MNYSEINFLALLVAAIAGFAFGALWYSPLLFGKVWLKELGFSDEDLRKANMGKIFGTSFVLILVMALGLALFFQGHGKNSNTLLSGLAHGLFIGLFFVAASTGMTYLYQRKSFKLWIIDASYQLIFLGIMGAIIEAWH